MTPSGTVFLVEDDDDIRTSAVWTLQNAGVAVEAHSSAEELLNALKPEMPGCYVLDLQLPEMSGMDLRRRLVEMGCRQPFLILSGQGDVALAVEAMQLGAVDSSKSLLNRDGCSTRFGSASSATPLNGAAAWRNSSSKSD